MPRINPFVGLFLAIAALHAGMFVWLRADIADVRAETSAVRAETSAVREDVAGNSKRLARIEAVQVEHGERLAHIEAGLAELRDGLSATNERLARVEGAVAGALGRPFPERMARAPGG